MKTNQISQARLKELFLYDEHSGRLVWRINRGPVKQGSAVGSLSNRGYLKTRINKVSYQVHRLLWLLVTGETPNIVDHINGNRLDNRFKNLRNVSMPENNKNMPRPKNNTSGFVGVTLHKPSQKWVAQISVNKKWVYLGFYGSFADAVEARKQANKKYNFHQNHGRVSFR